MKTIRLLSSLAAIAALFWAAALPAATAPKDSAKAKTPEWAGLFGDASLPVVWQSASAASEKIAAALDAQKFEGVADWAETIHLAAHALEDQVKIDDAERRKRLVGALDQAAKIADDVINGANHKEREKTVAAYGRLKAALALAKSRLPKDIVDAPAQTLRFAKSSGHAHDEKGGHVEKKK